MWPVKVAHIHLVLLPSVLHFLEELAPHGGMVYLRSASACVELTVGNLRAGGSWEQRAFDPPGAEGLAVRCLIRDIACGWSAL